MRTEKQKMPHQKTLGIIGGMSWESTESYYRLINEGVKAELGGLHSADLLIHSLDFAPIGELQAKGEWAQMGAILASSGKRRFGDRPFGKVTRFTGGRTRVAQGASFYATLIGL
ncbi:aspartate/glutamate racemase family protein [Psychrobacter celer]|uniref:aspartate/glutamate racemase family protein n=1 Tax=Psychrobacter celer TaxID=306572 RepID=UPI003FD11597